MECIKCQEKLEEGTKICPFCATDQTKLRVSRTKMINLILVVSGFLLLASLHVIGAIAALIGSMIFTIWIFKNHCLPSAHRNIYGLFAGICFFVSIFFVGMEIREEYIICNMSQQIAEELNISLFELRPVDAKVKYHPTEKHTVSYYYYHLDVEHINQMNQNIENAVWRYQELTSRERSFLEKFSEIPSSILSSQGYYIVYNRQTQKFEFPKNSLTFDFVFLYYDSTIDSTLKEEIQVYLYDIHKHK